MIEAFEHSSKRKHCKPLKKHGRVEEGPVGGKLKGSPRHENEYGGQKASIDR